MADLVRVTLQLLDPGALTRRNLQVHWIFKMIIEFPLTTVKRRWGGPPPQVIYLNYSYKGKLYG